MCDSDEGMKKTDLGDALVWMCTAETLFRPDPLPGYPELNASNVSHVCAGYAFEILFKVLVRVGGKKPKPDHRPSEANKRLNETDREKVKEISANHGWDDFNELLCFLDEFLCDKDRKYWGRPPEGGKSRIIFPLSPRSRIDSLKKLHDDLADFALKRIGEGRRDEHWPGL